MRDLKSSSENSITLFDKLSGSPIVIYYRTPTTKERVKYKSEQIQNVHKMNYELVFESQIEWAKKLIVGFREGSFNEDGKIISSDKESEHYDDTWKEKLSETSSDLLMLFTDMVMGETAKFIKGGDISEDFFSLNSGNGTLPGAEKKETNT